MSRNGELIERLRGMYVAEDTPFEAADALARLEAEDARLRESLEPFVEAFAPHVDEFEELRRGWGDPLPSDHEYADAIYQWALSIRWGDLRRARAALSPPPPEEKQ